MLNTEPPSQLFCYGSSCIPFVREDVTGARFVQYPQLLRLACGLLAQLTLELFEFNQLGRERPLQRFVTEWLRWITVRPAAVVALERVTL